MISCTLCTHLHPTGFCPVARAIVPTAAQENEHDCPNFEQATPGAVAARLAQPTRTGPGSRLAALWDAERFLAGGPPPSRYIVPITKADKYIHAAILLLLKQGPQC